MDHSTQIVGLLTDIADIIRRYGDSSPPSLDIQIQNYEHRTTVTLRAWNVERRDLTAITWWAMALGMPPAHEGEGFPGRGDDSPPTGPWHRWDTGEDREGLPVSLWAAVDDATLKEDLARLHGPQPVTGPGDLGLLLVDDRAAAAERGMDLADVRVPVYDPADFRDD